MQQKHLHMMQYEPRPEATCVCKLRRKIAGQMATCKQVDGVKYRRWLAKVDADGVSRQAGADTVDMKPKVA